METNVFTVERKIDALVKKLTAEMNESQLEAFTDYLQFLLLNLRELKKRHFMEAMEELAKSDL